MSNTLTLNNPLSESDWDKLCDVELEKTKHIWFKTPSGKRVDFLRTDILDKIRAEMEQAADKQFQIAMGLSDLNERYAHIQMENAYRHSLNVIDKYRSESEEK